MNIFLWVLQILLAAAFFAHGWLFLAPPPEIAEQMNANLSRWFQLFLGVAEIAGAIGLIIPGLIRRFSWLVSLAAAGIAFVSLSATVWHLVRAEYSSAGITAILMAMSAFVAYKRYRGLVMQNKGRVLGSHEEVALPDHPRRW